MEKTFFQQIIHFMINVVNNFSFQNDEEGKKCILVTNTHLYLNRYNFPLSYFSRYVTVSA